VIEVGRVVLQNSFGYLKRMLCRISCDYCIFYAIFEDILCIRYVLNKWLFVCVSVWQWKLYDNIGLCWKCRQLTRALIRISSDILMMYYVHVFEYPVIWYCRVWKRMWIDDWMVTGSQPHVLWFNGASAVW